MTVRGRPRRGRWLGALLAVSATMVLASCGGIIGSFVTTRQALSNAGYAHVSIGISGSNDLTVSASVDHDASAGEVREIAAIVWRDFPERFGSLHITSTPRMRHSGRRSPSPSCGA